MSAILDIRAQSLKAQGGYTLLEMAVVLLVIGMFIAAAIPIYDLHRQSTLRNETFARTQDIDTAIETFKSVRGRYPCPAKYTSAPGDTDYGQETACTNMTGAPGTCVDGLCFEESERTIDIETTDASGNPVTQTVRPLVIRGSLPFQAMNLEAEKSIDRYGGRFSYAVTQILTDKVKFRNNRGGISVVDGKAVNPNSLVEPAASAHYFVFSHGSDNIGAYSMYGMQISACNGPMHDNENCNTDATSKEAVYRHTLHSTENIVTINGGVTAPGAPTASSENSHFDDFVDFVGIGEQPLWESGEQNYARTDTMNNHNVVKGVIFMGKTEPVAATDTKLKMNIDGAAKINRGAGDSKGRISEVCAKGDDYCMTSAVLGADDPSDPRALKCAAGTEANNAPKGIKNSTITCAPPEMRCQDGKYLVGVLAGGMPNCASPPATCDQISKKICSVWKTLPGDSKLNSSVTLTAGASREEAYTCKLENGKGVWKAGAVKGVCTCKAQTITNKKSCGANMTGEIVEEETTVCPSGTKTKTVVSNTCKCVPSTSSRTESCPANFNGNVTYTTTVTCNGNKPTTTTQQTANSCKCQPSSATKEIDCPSGWNGKIKQQEDVLCPSGNKSGWNNVSHSCSCKPSYTRDVACDSSKYNVGKVTERCTYDCKSYTSSASAKCAPETNNCACKPSTTKTPKPCPSGYTGNVVVKTETKCRSSGIEIDTTEDDSACKPVVSTCTMTAEQSIVGYNKVTWRDGDSCSYSPGNNSCDDVKFCYRVRGVNDYTTHKCSCR